MSIQSDLLSAQKVHVAEYTLELFSLPKSLYSLTIRPFLSNLGGSFDDTSRTNLSAL